MVRAGRGKSAVRPRTSYVEVSGSEEESGDERVASKPAAAVPVKAPPKKRAIAAAKKPVQRTSNGAAKRSYAEDDGDDLSDDDVIPIAKKSKPQRAQEDYGSSGDEYGGDAGEQEGDDSDFEPATLKKKKATPLKRKPAAKQTKSPAAKKTKKTATTAVTKKIATPSRGGNKRAAASHSVKYSETDDEDEEEPEEESDEDSLPPGPRKSIKQAKQARSGKKAAPVGRKPAHPPVSEMVPAAIRILGERPKKGSSLAAIKGCMAEEWGVDIRLLAAKLKNYIINAVKDGELIQTKGKGANGRFTVPGLKLKKRKKKTSLTKKWDQELEPEYNPGKTARDEERERQEQEKEMRRQQRRDEIARKLEEKAQQPKKPVVRRTEWEVECIKAMKVVAEKTWYLVKFESWAKPSWEPEENLTGCQDAIDNFLVEEKVRLAEEEERRRREEEEGKYEVCRILEVKFPKSNKDKREFLIRWKGHGEEDDSWEPEENLDCRDIIDRFMKRFEKRLEATEKSLRVAPKKVERLQFAASARVGRRNNGFRVTYEDMDE